MSSKKFFAKNAEVNSALFSADWRAVAGRVLPTAVARHQNDHCAFALGRRAQAAAARDCR
jgi:hypothetical protein